MRRRRKNKMRITLFTLKVIPLSKRRTIPAFFQSMTAMRKKILLGGLETRTKVLRIRILSYKIVAAECKDSLGMIAIMNLLAL
jgi:hypothetical protein